MSSDKVLKRIRDAPNEEAAYEAQQMLKTIYHRLRSRGKLHDCYELLQQGAIAQLEKNQVSNIPCTALLEVHTKGGLAHCAHARS